MPARWLAARAAATSPGAYEMRAVNGPIWKGDAQTVVRVGSGTFTIDRAEWDFLPSRRLRGRLAYAMSLRGAGFEARYEAGRSLAGWSLRDLTARADAALAAAALPWIAAWRPEGVVSAASPALDLAEREVRGELRLDVKGASTALSQVRPLGSYRADVIAEGAAARVNVATVEGALRLSGQGRLEFPTRFSFTGEARGEGANAAALDPLLNLLGPARADGVRAIDWRTR
jgi:general secretion pathway protein N